MLCGIKASRCDVVVDQSIDGLTTVHAELDPEQTDA